MFDKLPALKAELSLHESQLKTETLEVIENWLRDKLSQTEWISVVQNIKTLAEGNDRTKLGQFEPLRQLGIDRQALQEAGVPTPLIGRVYRALWVYSLGIHEMIAEVSYNAHADKRHSIMGAIWQTYALLLEDYDDEDYVMALSAVQQQSLNAMASTAGVCGDAILRERNATDDANKQIAELTSKVMFTERLVATLKDDCRTTKAQLVAKTQELEEVKQKNDAEKADKTTSVRQLRSFMSDLERNLEEAKKKEEEMRRCGFPCSNFNLFHRGIATIHHSNFRVLALKRAHPRDLESSAGRRQDAELKVAQTDAEMQEVKAMLQDIHGMHSEKQSELQREREQNELWASRFRDAVALVTTMRDREKEQEELSNVQTLECVKLRREVSILTERLAEYEARDSGRR